MHKLARRTAVLVVPAALFATLMQSAAHADYRECLGTYLIQGANGNFVTAEVGRSSYEGMLRAKTNPTVVGTWERFRVWRWTNDVSGFQNYSIMAHNGKYLDTWNSYSGSL